VGVEDGLIEGAKDGTALENTDDPTVGIEDGLLEGKAVGVALGF
jgi:hypothetical protein